MNLKMHYIFSFVALSTALLVPATVAFTSASAFDLGRFTPEDIITRDVAVIGGGVAGTYSAISLKDKGKSVIVIEKKDRIGGHTETYIDPATGTTIDMGVMIFHDILVVQDFFKRFDLPLEKSPGFYHSLLNYDFRTGRQVNLSVTPSEEDVSAALATYTEQLSKYPRLEDGIFLPEPVPEDLHMPFGDFVKKYNIQAAVPTMYNYNPGVGNMMEIPTLEQFRYWGLKFVNSFTDDFLMTAHRNASELYSKAQAELSSSSSLLLKSEVEYADRGADGQGVRLVVRNSNGNNKLILAKKLIVAIPPKLDFVGPLDLSDSERALFEKYIDAGYYVGLVRNTGFPENQSISNAGPDTEYNFPNLPGAYSFAPTGFDSIQMVTYATPQSRKSFPLLDRTVKADIIRTVKTLQMQNPDMFVARGEPEWVDFRSHAPYSLQVTGKDIKDGFYRKLYALQGQRNTYWTGAAFLAEDTSALWKFSEDIVLPQLLASL